MIEKERLIKVIVKQLLLDDEPETNLEKELSELHEVLDYSDLIETHQDILQSVWASYSIWELTDIWTIAYYEKLIGEDTWTTTIIHIGYPDMSYSTVDELLEEINNLNSKVI